MRAAGFVGYWSLLALMLGLTALVLEERTSWYLSVDQLGYLTFARDLLDGRVFHHWPPADALAAALAPRVDMLSQTYVWNEGVLSCRYAPGFPLLLAAWIGLLGPDAAFGLNVALFTLLLLVLAGIQRRLFDARWSPIVGIGLAILFPTSISLWATTLSRDIAAHLAGLLGLLLLVSGGATRLAPARAVGAGLAVGFAMSVRPDAILYLLPAGLLTVRLRPPPRVVAAAAFGLALGLAPSFAHNWLATGNPLRPTQGMEVEEFLASAPVPDDGRLARVGYPSPPPAAWRGGTRAPVQGGGLRLSNLRRVLPENLTLLVHAHGAVFLGLAIWGALLSAVQRRALFLAAVPYTLAALLAFSFWGRSEVRYLVGVNLFIPLLVVEGCLGTLDLVQRLGTAGRERAARALAAGAALAIAGGALLSPASLVPTSALDTLMALVPAVVVVALVASATIPTRSVGPIAALVLALALGWMTIAMARSALGHRVPFQHAAVARARATFDRAVEPGAVVITTEDIGRPAENIEYYSANAHALYLTDLVRWRMPVALAARLLLAAGMQPYLLLPPDDPNRSRILSVGLVDFRVVREAAVAPAAARDWFVVSRFHRGVPLELLRIGPRTE